MFSPEPHCIYKKNQLGEVICQLRFPKIEVMSDGSIGKLRRMIEGAFPVYTARKEPFMPQPNLPVQNDLNHQFASEDGTWRVNVTSRFFSLATSRYTCWEEFAAKLDQPLATFLQIYRPDHIERVGLRYVNFISRQELSLEGIPFSALISPTYLGILADAEVKEIAATRSTVDADLAIRGGCRAKIHAGPGMVRRRGQQDNEPKFILDFDLYLPGNVELNFAAGALQTLHAQAFPLFRNAITKALHHAMEPDIS